MTDSLPGALPTERLVVISAGGREGLVDALIKLGKFLDLEVVLIDPTPDFQELPNVLIADREYDLTKFTFSDSDSVVILTHSEQDIPILTYLTTQNVRYVGVMGSMERAKGELAFLLKRGIPREFVESVKSPVGADIGARTTQEIAISIMSEVVATKRGKKVQRKSAMPEASLGPVRHQSRNP